MTGWAKRTGPVALVIAMGLGIYGQSLWFGFYYDDVQAIVNNPAIRTMGGAAASLVRGDATTGLDGAPGYRPLTVATYALDYAIAGIHPWSYHATNVVLLIATALAVYALAIALGAGSAGSLVAALVTLAHPLAVEAAVYPSARSSVLAALAMITSLAALARAWRGGSRAWYAAAFAAAGVACLSKESAVILPALAWCVTAPRLSPGVASDVRRRLRWVAPFAALVAAYLIVHGVVAPLSGVAVPYREAAGAAVVMVKEFVRLLVIPIGLTVDHQLPQVIPWATVAGAAGWGAGAAVVAIAVGRRLPLAALGGWLVVWTMAPLIPLALSTRVALVQEHRALLAVAGLGLIVGACAEAWRGVAASTRARTAVGIAAALLVGAYATLSWNRVGVWASEESLWRDAVSKAPDSPLAHTWLGTLAQRRGERDLAVDEFRQALRADPRYAFAALAVARLHHARGDRPAARAAYRDTLAIAPGSVQALAGLGLLAQEEGDLSAAASMYREVLRIAPRDLATRNNLATIVLAQGDYRAARDEYRAVLALDPDQPRVLTNLGYALLVLDEREAAIASLRRAIELDPADLRASWYLGEVFARAGEWGEAERTWRRADRMPEAAMALAWLYDRTGRPAEATDVLRRALARMPDTPAYARLRAEALARLSNERAEERP